MTLFDWLASLLWVLPTVALTTWTLLVMAQVYRLKLPAEVGSHVGLHPLAMRYVAPLRRTPTGKWSRNPRHPVAGLQLTQRPTPKAGLLWLSLGLVPGLNLLAPLLGSILLGYFFWVSWKSSRDTKRVMAQLRQHKPAPDDKAP